MLLALAHLFVGLRRAPHSREVKPTAVAFHRSNRRAWSLERDRELVDPLRP